MPDAIKVHILYWKKRLLKAKDLGILKKLLPLFLKQDESL